MIAVVVVAVAASVMRRTASCDRDSELAQAVVASRFGALDGGGRLGGKELLLEVRNR